MSSRQNSQADRRRRRLIPKTTNIAEEREETTTRKSIFKNVPTKERTSHYLYPRHNAKPFVPFSARKKTVAVPPQDINKDVILNRISTDNVPRRKRTTSYEYVAPQEDSSQPTPAPPEWLVQVMSRMDGAEHPKPIIEKTLDLNDVDPRQNRLSIPINSLIQKDFLTLDECRIIDDDDDTTNQGKMGLGAFLVDQRTETWNVGFKQWFMKTCSGSSYWSFVLRGEWSDVVENNELEAGDKISLWSFRCREILYFALVPPTSSAV